MKRGLAVIAARSDSLSRFTTAYARLAKLPAPRLDTVQRPGAGAPRRRRRDAPADSHRRADRTCRFAPIPDQLEQLLINLVHNASDAALQTGGGVTVGWKREGRTLRALDRR